MAPLPKPAAQRRRRNATPHARKVTVNRKKGSIPPLPTGREWHEETIRCWQTVWKSPISAIWIDVDVLALERWAALLDLVHTGADKTFTHQEIRMLEDRFGLSPLARRRLQWEVEQAGKKPDDKPVKGDEERWLRAVSD